MTKECSTALMAPEQQLKRLTRSFGRGEFKQFIDTDKCLVRATPHPFKTENISLELPEGLSLGQIVSQLGLFFSVRVWVDGIPVAPKIWNRYFPKKGSIIVVKAIPEGGGGDDGGKVALRLVATIAVIALAAWIAPPIAGYLAGTTAAEAPAGLVALVGGSIGLGGSFAINALIPLPPPDLDEKGQDLSRSLTFIEGARNTAKPFGVIPIVLGRHRIVPPFAAKPYTEVFGSTQYMRLLFCFGFGPLIVEDIKIGETPIETFLDLNDEDEYNLLLGTDDDDPLEIYTNNIFEESQSIKLTNPDAMEHWTTLTTQPNTIEVSVDFTFPGLFKTELDGDRVNKSVEIAVEWQPAGATDEWKITSAGESFGARTIEIRRLPPFVRFKSRFNNQLETVTTFYRRDILVINKFTGSLKWREGAPSRTSPGSVPSIGGVSWEGLAYVDRSSDDGGILTSGMITDIRKSTAPFGDDDSTTPITTEFAVTASSPADENANIAAGDLFFDTDLIKSTAKTASGLIRSLHIKFDSAGQYDIRARRVTVDSSGTGTVDEVYWTKLRSVIPSPPLNTTKKLALLEMRVKATDRVQGILDNINAVVTTVAPDWDGKQWTTRGTNNPASLFRYILQGAHNPRALGDHRVNLSSLKKFHQKCEKEDWTCNTVLDVGGNIEDQLRAVAATGRASLDNRDGKWGVVIDEEKTVPVQLFTPRNSYNYNGELVFPKLPHAFKVRFINEEKDYRQDERIVYVDGYDENNAVEFEDAEAKFITNSDQIFEDTRYRIKDVQLRPERHSFNADIEYLNCQRGDLILIQHDVPQFSLHSARINSLATSGGNVTSITIDDPLTMQTGQSYAVKIRRSDGKFVTSSVNTVEGDQTTLTFTTPIAIPLGPGVGDLLSVGPATSVVVELIVLGIFPETELTARLLCVDHAPEVHSVEEVPLFNSKVTLEPGQETPVIENIQSDENVLLLNTDGTRTSRILLTLGHTSNSPTFATAIQTQYRVKDTTTQWFWAPEVPKDSTEVSILPVEDGTNIEFRLRYRFTDGRFGIWTPIQNHIVIGKSSDPSDVSNFIYGLKNGRIELCWDENLDPDLYEYEIREGSSWGAATFLARIHSTCFGVNAFSGSKTFLIKARDLAGNYSTNATPQTITITAPIINSVVITYDGPDIIFTISTTEGTFPFDYVGIRHSGTDWDDATTVVEQVHTTTYQRRVIFTGSRTYRLKAFAGGTESSTFDVVVSPTTPSQVTGFSTVVIDNNVLFSWDESSASLPIEEYELRKGSTFGSASVIASVKATAFLRLEQAGGTYTYWIRAKDSAGNYSTETSITIVVDDPPDFTLYSQFVSDFETNATNEADVWSPQTEQQDGKHFLAGPTDSPDTKTYATHFTGNSWADMDDAIGAGHTIYGMDASHDGAAFYEEELDIGAVVSSSKIIISYVVTQLVGTVTVTPTISYKENPGDGWTDATAGLTEVFASTFQYIKVRFDLTATAGSANFCKIEDLVTTVRVKEITDQGTTTISGTGGTAITFNKTFAEVLSVVPTPRGTTNIIAIANRISATSWEVRAFTADTGTELSSATVDWVARGV